MLTVNRETSESDIYGGPSKIGTQYYKPLYTDVVDKLFLGPENSLNLFCPQRVLCSEVSLYQVPYLRTVRITLPAAKLVRFQVWMFESGLMTFTVSC